MKRSYTEYLNELSGNRIEILEELISNKFIEFKKFYKCISKQSDNIAHISYRFSSEDSLDLSITLDKGIDVNKFIDKISSKDYDIDIVVDGRVLYCTIKR